MIYDLKNVRKNSTDVDELLKKMPSGGLKSGDVLRLNEGSVKIRVIGKAFFDFSMIETPSPTPSPSSGSKRAKCFYGKATENKFWLYDLLKRRAKGSLAHGDILVYSNYREWPAIFADIDGTSLKFVQNPNRSGSGYLTIPKNITQKLDHALEYYKKIDVDNVDLEFGDDDVIVKKTIDKILHPTLLPMIAKKDVSLDVDESQWRVKIEGVALQYATEVMNKILEDPDFLKQVKRLFSRFPEKPPTERQLDNEDDLFADELLYVVELNQKIYKKMSKPKPASPRPKSAKRPAFRF